MNPYKDADETAFPSTKNLNYADIAAKLLHDNFLLTALELHTELVESGRELPQLREFFSNPGNFEHQIARPVEPGPIHRTPSQGTLDSLDLTRYSEDGGADRSGNEVAVLEFELRKARETINALRTNLTQAADCELNTSVKNGEKVFHINSLKPHEKRALNYLINEYLLIQDYKLTSITFSDENPDQDFEDWDDVGLNLSRPASLIALYRGVTAASSKQTCETSTQTDNGEHQDASCQTDASLYDDDVSICVSCQTSFDQESMDWNHAMLVQAEEIVLLKQQILALETDKINFQKLYDAALATLNSLSSPSSEAPLTELHRPEDLRREAPHDVIAGDGASGRLMDDMQLLSHTATENHYGSSTSTSSVTPDQFEIIDSEKNGSSHKDGSNLSFYEAVALGDDISTLNSTLRHQRGSATTLDDALSINEPMGVTDDTARTLGSGATMEDALSTDGGEWMRVALEERGGAPMGSMSSEIRNELLRLCAPHSGPNTGLGGDLLAELLAQEKPITPDGFVDVVADTLPRILPHMLVARRCEAAALLACTAHLATGGRKARTLQLLLSLVKKPDDAEMRTIAEAVALISKWGGASEVLPPLADALASRAPERRALAARACLAAAPHAPPRLAASLVGSLARVMCAASETDVRVMGVKGAVLVCPVAEHKWGEMAGLMYELTRDDQEVVAEECRRMLVPVIARSALLLDKFSSELLPHLLEQINKSAKDRNSKHLTVYLKTLIAMIPAIVVFVVNVTIVRTGVSTDEYQRGSPEGEAAQSEAFLLSSPRFYMDNDSVSFKCLLDSFSSLLESGVSWTQKEWVADVLISHLLGSICTELELNDGSVMLPFIVFFNKLCESLGPSFSSRCVMPVFSQRIQALETRMERLEQVDSAACAVCGVYLGAVLPCVEERNACIGRFLKKWMVCGGVCNLPTAIFSTPLLWLAANRANVLDTCLVCFQELIASSKDGTSGGPMRCYVSSVLSEVSSSAALPDHSIITYLLPAVQQLVNDPETSVRERAIPALGRLFILSARPGLRATRDSCWCQLEAAVAGAETLGHRGSARLADTLADVIAREQEQNDKDVCGRVLANLCKLCHNAPILTGELLSSLIPALQLAIHFTPFHQEFYTHTLIPALRKLENIEAPNLLEHKLAVEALINSVKMTLAQQTEVTSPTRAPLAGVNILASSESVGRRVSHMLQHSKPAMNLQNIFKKKT